MVGFKAMVSTIDSALKLIHDTIFQNNHKKSPKEFSRSRKLNFATIVGMLLRMVKSSLQIECNLMGNLLGIEAASKQAFSQARAKILPEGFQELHKDGIRAYYTSASNNGLWGGYRRNNNGADPA